MKSFLPFFLGAALSVALVGLLPALAERTITETVILDLQFERARSGVVGTHWLRDATREEQGVHASQVSAIPLKSRSNRDSERTY